MKRILKGVVVALLLAVLSTAAFALTEGDWEFQLLDDHVMITDYLGNDEVVEIPSEIFGLPVTEFDDSPFFGEYDDNYEACRKIKKIIVPSTIKELPEEFAYDWVEGMDLEEVVLPEGLISISYGAFRKCDDLKTINIPSTVTSIEDYAFYGCKKLDISLIGKNIKKIGNYAFRESGITSLFLECGDAFDIYDSDYVFADCPLLETVSISEGLTFIPEGMFANCKSLMSVDFPLSLLKIYSSAFSGCENLKNLVLPVNLKLIDDCAFNNCLSLTEVVIPNGCTEVGSGAFYYGPFYGIPNLKSLYIPDSVETMCTYIIKDSPNCIIYCSGDSFAAKFCKDKKISYITDKSVNSKVTVLYNGTRISFHKYDQNPELINNRTLVPLRAIFEAMGAEVTWDDSVKTAIAKRDGVEIRIQIGANEMYKDGEAIPVDVPAQLINDRTMVPVRVIAEAFGADVGWNAAGYTVLIEE